MSALPLPLLLLLATQDGTPPPAAATPPPSTPTATPQEDPRDAPLGDDEDDAPRKARGSGTALEDLGIKARYFPLWFPDDMHPQLEESRWVYVLSVLFIPGAAFWVPYFMVKPHPDVDVRELLKTALVRWGIQLGGHLLLYAGWFVLGITCPPGIGFYLWLLPMYAAQLVWMVVGNWQTIMSMMAVWDASLWDQNIPDRPRRKPGTTAHAEPRTAEP